MAAKELVPTYVFDGVHHSMKDAMNSSHDKNQNKDLATLKEMKTTLHIRDRKNVDDLRKKLLLLSGVAMRK